MAPTSENYEAFIGPPLHRARFGGHVEVEQHLIEAGVPVRGEHFLGGCMLCHREPNSAGFAGDNGTNLWYVVGRPTGAAQNVNYSKFMMASGIIWTIDSLNSYIAAPNQYLPGTTKIQNGFRTKSIGQT
jgi:cytochrome c